MPSTVPVSLPGLRRRSTLVHLCTVTTIEGARAGRLGSAHLVWMESMSLDSGGATAVRVRAGQIVIGVGAEVVLARPAGSCHRRWAARASLGR